MPADVNEMEKVINPDKYYYAKEAAELVPYSYKTFLKWIKTRKIQVSRPAGTRKFLIKGQAIIDYIDAGKLKASRSAMLRIYRDIFFDFSPA